MMNVEIHLRHPLTMPIRHVLPFDEELALTSWRHFGKRLDRNVVVEFLFLFRRLLLLLRWLLGIFVFCRFCFTVGFFLLLLCFQTLFTFFAAFFTTLLTTLLTCHFALSDLFGRVWIWQ